MANGRNNRRTLFDPNDFKQLKEMFLMTPVRALRHFKRAQVGCLMELPVYREILAESPDHAFQIALEAAQMGIAVHKSFE